MGKEIEKKYVLRENGTNFATDALLHTYDSVEKLKAEVLKKGKMIQQGYLPVPLGLEIIKKLKLQIDFCPTETRLRNKAGSFYFTLKGSGDLSRNEIEIEIQQSIFDEYWEKTAKKRISKVRLEMPFEKYKAEIDVYTDRDLIIAEVEIPTIENAKKLRALGKDVTTNLKYKNKNLVKK